MTLSPYEDDLDDGIVSIHGPTGKEMLGKSVEDEVELPWKGEIATQRSWVLKRCLHPR